MTDTFSDRALALLHEHRGLLILSEWRFVDHVAELRRRGQELDDVAIAGLRNLLTRYADDMPGAREVLSEDTK